MHAKPTRPAGLYIHLPFVRDPESGRRAAIVDEPPREAYLEALRRELDTRCPRLEGRRLCSVYLGGGDPSCVPASWIQTLLADVAAHRDLTDVEVTLEAHPADVDRRAMARWRRAGVNRLILGLRSFEAATLRSIGCSFEPSTAARALGRSRAFGTFEVGADLTFAVPGQTHDQFLSDLARIAELGLPGSVFGYEFGPVGGGEADDEVAADMLESLVEWAGRHRLRRYEIASVCRPGRASRHNRLYWDGGEYVGLGLGAASFTIDQGTPRRRRNVDDLEAYLAGEGPAVDDALAPGTYLTERVVLALRHRAGLDWSVVVDQFEEAVDRSDLETAEEALTWAVDRGFGRWDGDRYRPTDRGLDLADGLARKMRRRLGGTGS